LEKIKISTSPLEQLMTQERSRGNQTKTSPSSLREFSCADIKLLDLLQRNAFNYFVQNRDEYTRLPLDRSTAYSPASISAAGFGLAVYCIAAEHGWISRQEAAFSCFRMLSALIDAPQGSEIEGTSGVDGLMFHFLDPKEVTRACDLKFWPQLHFEEGKKTPRIDVELSIVDTALFCLGVICVKEYFNQGTPREKVLRELANQHICRPRWDSLLTEHNLLRMGWKPETGMLDATFKGFNEGLLLYLVALGSPTHRIPDESWRAQLAGVQPQTDYGETFLRMHDFPLFGYHYPLCWFDFRELFDPLNQESGFDYFENAQRAVRAQHRYAIKNPMGWRGYGADIWGLSASDSPTGDGVHGPADLDGKSTDNGTSVPPRWWHLYRWHRAWCCGHCTSGLKNARFCLPKQALSVLSI
jgi:hypothetical protein